MHVLVQALIITELKEILQRLVVKPLSIFPYQEGHPHPQKLLLHNAFDCILCQARAVVGCHMLVVG